MVDKVVLVTGAQQGIGRACALAFAAAGYDVAVKPASALPVTALLKPMTSSERSAVI